MFPYLFHLGHLYLPTFGALAAAGLMLALPLSERTSRLLGMNPHALWDAGIFVILAAFVSSRLLLIIGNISSFVAFPVLLLAVPSLTAPGLLLTVAATSVWLLRKQIPILPALDAWAPCGTLVWTFLALGHFAEGSDPGLPTHLFVGVRMPGEATPLHPVALYAAAVAASLTALLYRRLKVGTGNGTVAAGALLACGASQFLLSFVRQPERALSAGLDSLQWVALAMLAAGGALLAFSRGRPPAIAPTELRA